MEKGISPASGLAVAGRKLTLARREFGPFREMMLNGSGSAQHARWKARENTHKESFLGAYCNKIEKAISNSRAEKKKTERLLSAASSKKQEQEVALAELEFKISKTLKSFEKDRSQILAMETDCGGLEGEVKSLVDKSQELREEIENDTFLSKRGNHVLNKVWKEFARDVIGLPEEFKDIFMEDQDISDLTNIFLIGHPVYGILFDISDRLDLSLDMTPLQSLGSVAEKGGYKMPDFSAVKSVTDIDVAYMDHVIAL